MKKTLLLLLGIFSLALFTHAQHTTVTNGYWVVESNIKTPKEATVLFYSNDNKLIYKENITGIKLKPAKKKTVVKLNEALQQALTRYEADNKMAGNQNLLALFKQ